MCQHSSKIDDALRSLARVIDRYGDVYWPIFERFERELEQRQRRLMRLNAYLGKPEP